MITPKTVQGKKYELLRHPTGIYYVRRASGQGPMISSEVQKLIDEKNKLKHQLKVTRKNNQRYKKDNQILTSLNATNSENIEKLKTQIQVRQEKNQVSVRYQ